MISKRRLMLEDKFDVYIGKKAIPSVDVSTRELVTTLIGNTDLLTYSWYRECIPAFTATLHSQQRHSLSLSICCTLNKSNSNKSDKATEGNSQLFKPPLQDLRAAWKNVGKNKGRNEELRMKQPSYINNTPHRRVIYPRVNHHHTESLHSYPSRSTYYFHGNSPSAHSYPLGNINLPLMIGYPILSYHKQLITPYQRHKTLSITTNCPRIKIWNKSPFLSSNS